MQPRAPSGVCCKAIRAWFYAVTFSPDGRLIVSGSIDGTVRVWDAATGAERRVLQGHSCSVRAVAFSPDGQLIVLNLLRAPRGGG